MRCWLRSGKFNFDPSSLDLKHEARSSQVDPDHDTTINNNAITQWKTRQLRYVLLPSRHSSGRTHPIPSYDPPVPRHLASIRPTLPQIHHRRCSVIDSAYRRTLGPRDDR
jgi:hypothetical protein